MKLLQVDLHGVRKKCWGKKNYEEKRKLNLHIGDNKACCLPSVVPLIWLYLIAFSVKTYCFVSSPDGSFFVGGGYSVITSSQHYLHFYYKMSWFWKGKFHALYNVNHLSLWDGTAFTLFGMGFKGGNSFSCVVIFKKLYSNLLSIRAQLQCWSPTWKEICVCQ